MSDLPPPYDASIFRNDAFTKRVEKPWGWELHWTPAGLPYMGKVLHIKAGARLSLQLHDEKRESWLLINGRVKVVWQDSAGELIETELEPGQGYTCALGQKHRLVGITDCDVVEVSTPELGTTWRLEDDYARPHETTRQRALERGEA
ncbi:MAG: cupin [Dehalococcoidia bacterium]|nr:cupin [Dehalococcoidia bacterium]